ncbi:cyclic nucleotide-binding domain-containing protein [Paracoccus limosus]|uniref:Cyclic nucleotide-binding domain-containing protein n=1 Tax=Paracoccus limosus TaxID=913252 RepID=A0A844H9Y0_9RHOB|nr:Crp/Fnr family transcriptional regulator [Paracoccus limosus]MTH36500.1 cyclic nucleotide-binding domain-containing protein [Paracoccus limosus]
MASDRRDNRRDESVAGSDGRIHAPRTSGSLAQLRPMLLDGLSDAQRLAFLKECQPLHLPGPAEILSQGEPPRSCYLIVQGRVEITFLDHDGNVVLVHVAGPGEMVGEVEILSDLTCAATCRTYPHTRLLTFGAALLTRHVPPPILMRNLAALFHNRLLLHSRMRAITQFYPAEARVRLHLLNLADNRSEVQVNQAQLAQMAGCSRQTVNRVLGELRAEGLIVTRRGAVRILNGASMKLGD